MSNTDLNIDLIVKELKQETQDYLSIRFERPRSFQYEAGDWMDIRFPISEFPVGRTYSFASSPTEFDLLIAFKRGVSRFKKVLEEVKPGEKMLITQYGSNGFLLNKRYKSLFIAGGIGITPFRSMIKEAVDNKRQIDIVLVYLNHNENFPFQKEFQEWEKALPSLKIQYMITGKEGRLTKEKLQKFVPDTSNRISYVAGSPGMISSTKNLLTSLAIKEKEIQIEEFEGY